MTDTIKWTVTVDTVTDALVRSHLAGHGTNLSFNAFIIDSVQRELNRVALREVEHAKSPPTRNADMWEIIIPLPPRR